jgi:hypothetical protein
MNARPCDAEQMRARRFQAPRITFPVTKSLGNANEAREASLFYSRRTVLT